jgi:hypothetical protein
LSQISACLRSLAHLFPIWFTLFAAIFLAANYGSSRYLHYLDNSRLNAKERQAAAESREEARATFARYGLDYFHRVYPGKSESEILQLIQDQAKTPIQYEPFVEFRSSASIRPTLNIHSAGFRLIGPAQGPWPIDKKALNIFVFGGSMALGSGVADDEAIPARLQVGLRASTGIANLNVYNFASGSHFSSQEVTYLQNQLRGGIVPDVIVFIDGENDFYFWNGETSESALFRWFVGWYGSPTPSQDFSIEALPLFRFAHELRSRIDQPVTTPAKSPEAPLAAQMTSDQVYESEYHDGADITDPDRIRQVIDRYLTNKKIAEGIAAEFHIEPYFVWQPSPLYKYDLRHHSRNIPDGHRRARYGYPVMAAYVQTHEMGQDFLWCSDIQEHVFKPLYVDVMHYNPAGNRLVADCMISGLLSSGIIDRAKRGREANASPSAADGLEHNSSGLQGNFKLKQ